VAPLHSLAARPALAHMHHELSLHHFADDLALKLLGRVRCDHVKAAAMRTSSGQLGVMRLIGLLGRKAGELRAVFVTRLAARTLWLRIWRPLGEGTGLPLPGTTKLLDDTPQFGDLLTEFTAARALRLIGVRRLAIHDGVTLPTTNRYRQPKGTVNNYGSDCCICITPQ